MLTAGAVAVGALWAETWRNTMRQEGRAIAGGWPGTLPEARARVTAYFGNELPKRKLPLISPEEVLWTAAAAYQKAKKDWLGSDT